ncbi:MAG: YeiH family putative sulfate export transporter [Alphaproteobacteria bacterium]|nr:YeiH family putative sulfate export transporter [Alphaproteobacteria bacterium]MCB9975481.1 YeiH family putative sulfate export transporter [Rhodospirillales bacterium]
MKTRDPLEKYRFMDSLEGVPEDRGPLKETPLALLRSVAPGLMVCGLITLASILISEHYSTPVMLMCLLIGMAFHFLYEDPKTRRGIQFTSQHVLKIGVALIGARIMLSQFTALGFYALAGISLITLFILFIGPVLGRLLGMDREQGLLIGGATAICGASAALAISSVLPPSKNLERQTLTAVIGVTAMGTAAMIAYPVILGVTGFDSYHSGVIIGGTIHDVSQVVGAGYSISPEAGNAAVLIKLIRVFMLLPILIGLAWLYKTHPSATTKRRFFSVPPFLIGFLVLAGLNSAGALPGDAAHMLETVSKWMLVMAIAAVGLKTSMKEVVTLGYGPVLLVVTETLILLAFYCALSAFGMI